MKTENKIFNKANRPKVSIVCPIFNISKKTLNRCLHSIRRQSYKNIELIIINDGSDIDHLEPAIISFSDQIDIKLINFDINKGAGFARSKGIEIASGKYIAFHDADDFWVKNKLLKQVLILESENIDIVTTDHIRLGQGYRKCIKTPKLRKWIFFMRNPIVNSSVMMSAHLAKKTKYSLIRRRQDYAFWLTLVKQEARFKNIDYYLTYYDTTNENSLSRKKYYLNLKYNFLAHRDSGSCIFISIFFVIMNVFERILRR